MGLSVSKGWQGVSFESVFVWSFSFWNESVLAQNYTKMCCQETLSFVSMSLQIFPNKFDVSQSVPAFISAKKSFSLNTRSPGLAGSSGTSTFLTCQCQALCHSPTEVLCSCSRGSPVVLPCRDETLMNFPSCLNPSDEGHYMCTLCLYCCLIMSSN